MTKVLQDNTKTFKFTRAKLDKQSISPETLAKGDRYAYDTFYDADCSVLALRISQNNTKSFVAFRWDPQKQRTDRTTLGRYQADAFEPADFIANPIGWWKKNKNCLLSIDMARTLALAVIGDKRDHKREAREATQELTLGELFDEYIERHSKKSGKSTWTDQRKLFDRHLSGWKNSRLTAITSADVDSLHGKLGKESGPYLANRVIQLLRAVYNKGKKWKLFESENPATGITLFKEESRDRFLSDEEYSRLWQVLLEERDSDVRDFIMIAMLTGARRNNILSMRWEEVDLVSMLWTIPETKNGEKQDVALDVREIEILEHRREEQRSDGYIGPYVFPGPGATGHLVEPKWRWNKIRSKAGIPDVTIHDLRRSVAASMANANVNLALIKAALGHKDMKTTVKVYARTGKEAERGAKRIARQSWMASAESGETTTAKVIPVRPADSPAAKRNSSKESS